MMNEIYLGRRQFLGRFFSDVILTVVAFFASLNAIAKSSYSDFNKDWKFSLSDNPSYSARNFDDSAWRKLDIPHDWSIELPFDVANEGCTGYLPGGIAWYSKTFDTPKDGELCYIIFDGIYNNSQIFLNGKEVGAKHYGYAPFYFDITEYLNRDGKPNRLAVRVDHSAYADSRWYSGSGIYRNVKLMSANKLHIPVWGTKIVSKIAKGGSAEIDFNVKLNNADTKTQNGNLKIIVSDKDGKQIAEKILPVELNGKSSKDFETSLNIDNPKLWDVNEPNLYTASYELSIGDKIVQEQSERFGVRSLEFDAGKGFFLNGKNMKIKGVCLHHDGGLVGSAVPKEVWQRRLSKLKEAGCNAIRGSHNPVSEEFLELCDEMGFLFQEEFFDEWDYPKDKRFNCALRVEDRINRGYTHYFLPNGEKDLKDTMRRDMNHPCIFQWSIGNEIEWTYAGNKESTGFFSADAKGGYFWNRPPYSTKRIKEEYKKFPKSEHTIGDTAHKLAGWVREMDTTRPVIANCILPSISYESGYIDALDIAGFSYRRVMYDYAKKNYPKKPVMGTENVGQWHEWKAVIERPFVMGMFIWTGIDYLGESTNKWPLRANDSGLLDTAGFEKPSYYMMKSLWTEAPCAAIYTSPLKTSPFKMGKDGKIEYIGGNNAWEKILWRWHDVNPYWGGNYRNNEKIVVEVYSNCDSVELFLNGESLGMKYLKDFEDRIYKWVVPYKAGELSIKGNKDGEIISESLKTSGDIDTVNITCEGNHIIVQLVDKNGLPVKDKEAKIQFSLPSNNKIIGIDNGYGMSVTPFKTDKVKTRFGRCLLLSEKPCKPSDVKFEILTRCTNR